MTPPPESSGGGGGLVVVFGRVLLSRLTQNFGSGPTSTSFSEKKQTQGKGIDHTSAHIHVVQTARYERRCLRRFLRGSDSIPFGFWLFFCVHVRFWLINWGNQPYTSRNQCTVPPGGNQLKNPLLQRRSSSFCLRCIIRRNIIWSWCPSF